MNPHGESPLHFAVKENNVDQVKIALIDCSANIVNFKGSTPLIYAAINGNMEICNILLENYANPRETSGFSGKYPDEITNNHELRQKLKTIREKIDCILNSIPMNTMYRLRKWGEDSLNFILQKDTVAIKNWPNDYKLRKDLIELSKNQIVEKLRNEWKFFYKYLDEWINGEFKQKNVCVFCGDFQGKKYRCGKCETTFFCGKECQINAFPYHRLICVKNQ
jgi:ankyrin repeat protein